MVVDKLLKNATNAEQIISLLRQRLTSLQTAIEQQRRLKEQHEFNKLAKENECLKNQVEKLKFDLDCIRVQNGVKPVPLPKKSTIVPLDVASPEKPSQGIIKGGTEKTEMVEKVEAPKESKKANVKDKGSKKKDNPSKAQSSEVGRPVDASRLDMRIGKIVHVDRHPDADTLYVEKVDIGEEKPRTIVSGLVNHVKLEELQDRLAIFMCNLKPVKMRGILSQGMIMCATGQDGVQPLTPPDGSVIGDKVRLQGYTEEPDELLNPKKKIWEQVKPDMRVNADGIATYKAREFYVEEKGVCTSPRIRNCPIT